MHAIYCNSMQEAAGTREGEGVVAVADHAGRAAVAAEPLLVMEGRGVVAGGCSDGD